MIEEANKIMYNISMEVPRDANISRKQFVSIKLNCADELRHIEKLWRECPKKDESRLLWLEKRIKSIKSEYERLQKIT